MKTALVIHIICTGRIFVSFFINFTCEFTGKASETIHSLTAHKAYWNRGSECLFHFLPVRYTFRLLLLTFCEYTCGLSGWESGYILTTLNLHKRRTGADKREAFKKKKQTTTTKTSNQNKIKIFINLYGLRRRKKNDDAKSQ